MAIARRTMFLWGGLVLTAPVAGRASEQSERLVAQGQLAYQNGRFAEARDRFAEAVAADSHDASAQYGIGLALGKLDRWEEARAAFERAVALRPDFTAAQRALGLASYHLGEAALERKENERASEHQKACHSGKAARRRTMKRAMSLPRKREPSGPSLWRAHSFH